MRREHVFEDSFQQLRLRSPDEMRAKLSVSFVGEEGIDAGGVSREWYQVCGLSVCVCLFLCLLLCLLCGECACSGFLHLHSKPTKNPTKPTPKTRQNSTKPHQKPNKTHTKKPNHTNKVMAREIFNPDLALFVAVPDG